MAQTDAKDRLGMIFIDERAEGRDGVTAELRIPRTIAQEQTIIVWSKIIKYSMIENCRSGDKFTVGNI